MKFECGDLYKFIVSTGMALAAGSVWALWLLLTGKFDIGWSDRFALYPGFF